MISSTASATLCAPLICRSRLERNQLASTTKSPPSTGEQGTGIEGTTTAPTSSTTTTGGGAAVGAEVSSTATGSSSTATTATTTTATTATTPTKPSTTTTTTSLGNVVTSPKLLVQQLSKRQHQVYNVVQKKVTKPVTLKILKKQKQVSEVIKKKQIQIKERLYKHKQIVEEIRRQNKLKKQQRKIQKLKQKRIKQQQKLERKKLLQESKNKLNFFNNDDYYVSQPILSSTAIIIIGSIIFILAKTYPSLILLLTLGLSKLIPYCFRKNDDATSRRQICRQFELDLHKQLQQAATATKETMKHNKVHHNDDHDTDDTEDESSTGSVAEDEDIMREDDDHHHDKEVKEEKQQVPKIDKPYERAVALNEFLFHIPDTVHVEEKYWINRRGMALFTCIMKPMASENTATATPSDDSDATPPPIKAVVCFCHGYLDTPTYNKRRQLAKLVQAGFAVVMIEYEGHGRSDGTLGLISDWDELIEDTSSYFSQILLETKEFQNVPSFLMGESMGGAVAYCTYNRCCNDEYNFRRHLHDRHRYAYKSSLPKQVRFRGVVLVCPMCKIADDMVPPDFVIKILKYIVGSKHTSSFMGMLPIAPAGDVSEFSARLVERAIMMGTHPGEYGRKPRLATARELIDVTARISKHLSKFDAPFLVQHGKADRVTDPKLSEALYNEAKSTDKTLRLYDGFWHSLLGGETEENINIVLQDSIQWILDRLE